MNLSKKVKFAIAIGVSFAIVICIYVYMQKQQAEQDLILSTLQKNDFFIFSISAFSKTEKTRFDYAIAKIIKADDLKADYQVSTTSYRFKKDLVKAIRLDRLVADNYFSNKTESIPLSELKILAQQNAIKELLRPNGHYLYGGIAKQQEFAQVIQPKYDFQELNELAINSYQAGDIDAAFALFKEGAEAGESWSQINLANMYLDGEGTEINIDNALYWLNLAYQSGNKNALAKLTELCTTQSYANNKHCTINK